MVDASLLALGEVAGKRVADRIDSSAATIPATPSGSQPVLLDFHPVQVINFYPSSSVRFCIPPNPVLQSLRLRAELNLYKIRTAGTSPAWCGSWIRTPLRRTPPVACPRSAPADSSCCRAPRTFRPTPYRFAALLDRAKQLAQMAAPDRSGDAVGTRETGRGDLHAA